MRARAVFAAVLLVLMTLAAYVPAVRGGFIWDDELWITGNSLLRSPAGLARIWFDIDSFPQYYPLTLTTFSAEYHLWGLNPAGYHLVNVLLHATSVVLLWRILAGLRVPGAWMAAAVFSLHPVHVESVAWATERKNVLSGVFYLTAALAYLRFALDPGEGATRSVRVRWYGVALLLFLCALFSKTVASSLPAALLLGLWWKRGRIRRADVYPLVPFLVLALLMGLLTAALERHHVEAVGEEWNFSPIDRCLIAGRALWFYAGKLAWPAPLIFIYPRWVINSHLWWQYLYPAAALAVVVGLWLARHRIGRGPLAAVLFFAGTLVPALGFFNVYPMRFSFVADHFQYLASIGMIVLVVAAGAEATAMLGTRGRRAAPVVAACILMVLGALTWRQGQVYAGLETLWEDTIAKNPSAWMAHGNLAAILGAQGRSDEAIAHCEESLRLKPDFPEGHNNLGAALTNRGKPDEAIRHFVEALRLRPAYAEALHNMGFALASQGKTDEAVMHYTEALRLKPAYPEAYNNLGLAMIQQGKIEEATRDFAEAVRLNPAYSEAYLNLGLAMTRQGRIEEATSDFAKAVRLNPAYPEAHNNLGLALADQGKTDEAIMHYTEALRLKPAFLEAYNNRGLAYGRKGDLATATRNFSRAIELKPDYAIAYINRAVAYCSLMEYDKAWADVKTYRQLGQTPNPELVRKLTEATGRSE